MPAELRVVLAEDSYLVREGTRQLLESTGEVTVVAAVGTAEELLDAVERLRPDAVLTDIRMPPDHGTEGIRAAHAIRAAHPGVGVVVLSQHAEEGYALELFREGADGLAYLLKERIGDRAQLVHALAETCRGGSVVDPVLLDALVGRRRLAPASNRVPSCRSPPPTQLPSPPSRSQRGPSERRHLDRQSNSCTS